MAKNELIPDIVLDDALVTANPRLEDPKAESEHQSPETVTWPSMRASC